MRRGPKFVATLVAVALVAVLTALDQTVVATALPHMIAELQGAAILGWVFTAYFVAATATVAVAGKLADLFGRRTVFLTSVAIFMVGSLLCGVANSMLLLVLSRGVQGIGAGCVTTLSFIVMADLFSARERGKWQAVNNAGFATASAVGPSVGGILSDGLSWRWIFLINVPLCLVTLGVVWYGLQARKDHGASLSLAPTTPEGGSSPGGQRLRGATTPREIPQDGQTLPAAPTCPEREVPVSAGTALRATTTFQTDVPASAGTALRVAITDQLNGLPSAGTALHGATRAERDDVPRSAGTRPRVRIDWAGAGWSMLGIVAILLVLTFGGREFAWTSPEIAGLVGAAIVSATLLWRTERRATDPLIPAGILKGNVVPYACVAFFATFFVWFTMILLAPLRLQLVLGTTATEAGALLTPGIVLSPICAFVAGQVLSRTGRYRPTIRIGAVAMLAGLAMLLYVPPDFAQVWILVSFAIVGLGTGCTAPPLMIGFQNAISHRQLGAAIGLFSLFRQLGASVGTAVIGSIVGSGLASVGVAAMAGAIQTAVLVQLAAGVVVVVCVWLMADVPLGNAQAAEADLVPAATKGVAWTSVVADH